MIGRVFLKPNVLVEPLFNQWYAWLGLIPPATAASYVANSHLRIMRSFVAAPQTHVSALSNPLLMGGPFINYDARAVGAIKSLIETTVREQPELLRLAEEIRVLDELLGVEGSGYSLEPLYKSIPESLKGYVELVYDVNNHPSFRIIEGLMYKSDYYDESHQSLGLELIYDDDRPFVFSTPRLESEDQIHLKVPYASDAVDELFRMKFNAGSISAIRDILNLKGGREQTFSSFFTETPPRQGVRYQGEGVRIRYFGHATLLIETKDVAVLTDPVVSCHQGNGTDRYTFEDLPPFIDYILITHNHQDHCMLETLLQLRHKTGNLIVPKNSGGSVIDPSMKLALRQIGFKNVSEIDEMEEVQIAGGRIVGLPFIGEHADLNIRSKIAYSIQVAGRAILCVADSNNLESRMYGLIHRYLKEVDVIFLGMECDGGPLSWVYGPLLTKALARKFDQSRRLSGSDCDRGIGIIDQLKPKQVYVYAMGQEPWMTFVTAIHYTPESRPIIESDKLIAECRRRGIESERLFSRKEILLDAA